MLTDSVHGANLVDIVHGGTVPDVGDQSEDFIEAGKLHRDSMGWEAPGVRMLESLPAMRTIVTRAGRDYASRETIELPPARPVTAELGVVLAARSSADEFTTEEFDLTDLATLLRTVWEPVDSTGAAFGCAPLRPSPSAGALGPIDILVAARNVRGLEPAVYFVQMNHTGQALLAPVHHLDIDALAEASLRPELVSASAITLAVMMSPWRSRFKYGHRAVRFALMEAGHVVQNITLVAAAEKWATRALGGFVDNEVERCLGVDGVNEVITYLVPVGHRRAPVEG